VKVYIYKTLGEKAQALVCGLYWKKGLMLHSETPYECLHSAIGLYAFGIALDGKTTSTIVLSCHFTVFMHSCKHPFSLNRATR
jgi:hypothetical protein